MHINASGLAIDAILTQPGEDGMDYLIIYSNIKLNKAEWNYLTTKREALGMVFALQKYRHYLLANPFIFYTDHQALKYLINKPLHHGRICRWLLLFQEFEFELVFQTGRLNVRLDDLSRIDKGQEQTGVEDDLPETHLFWIEGVPAKLEGIAQFLENGQAPDGMSMKKKQILAMKATPYNLINEILYKMGLDDILGRCVLEHERENIMHKAHYGPVGGHF